MERVGHANLVGQSCALLCLKHCGTSKCAVNRLQRGEEGICTEYFEEETYKLQTSALKDADGTIVGYLCEAVDITELARVERQLKVNSEIFRIAMLYTKCAIWNYDSNTKMLVQETDAITIFQSDSVLLNVPEALIDSGEVHPDSAESFRELFRAMDKGQKKIARKVKVRASGGDICWYEITLSNIFDKRGKPIRAIGVVSDITYQVEMQQRAAQERKFLESVMKEAIAVYEVNLTQGTVINRRAELEPLTDKEDICCQLLLKGEGWMALPKDRGIIERHFQSAELFRAFKSGIREVKCEYRCISKRVRYWVKTTASLIETAQNGDICAFIYVQNINDAKKQAEVLRAKATMDVLTGAYNRAYGIERITEALIMKPKHTLSALLMIDIDNFKQVNDTLGHAAGDQVLIEVTRRMSDVFRKSDIICRFGGDEFVVFLNDMTEPLIKKRANLLCEVIKGMGAAKNVNISLSVGIALIREQTAVFQEIYDLADQALYQAKRAGKNRYVIYTEPDGDADKGAEA